MILDTDADGEEIRLGTTADLAHELGVTINEVRNWYRRRPGNGFPEHVCIRRIGNGMNARHWDVDEVRVWHLFVYSGTTEEPLA